MLIETVTGLLVVTGFILIVLIIALYNYSKTLERMRQTNNGLHNKLLEQEEAIELVQRRSDILKDKLNNIKTLMGSKYPIRVLKTQVIAEIKR